MRNSTNLRNPSRRLFAVLLSLASTTLFTTPVLAQSITTNGDISPADNPFEVGDRGIPVDGSTIAFAGVNNQGNPLDFDGTVLVDEDGTVVGQRNYERAANVQVGRFSTGQMLMTAGAVLRFGDLTIGGSVLTGSNTSANNLDPMDAAFGDGSTSANGYVEISGIGTIYNNHPFIVPTEFQPIAGGTRTIFTVPDTFNPDTRFAGGVVGPSDLITNINRENEANNEYDLYVGLTGNGTLNITEGGRAEIHDGVFAGLGPAAVGTINVSGGGSYLGAYGLKDISGVAAAPNTAQPTLIGTYGHGILNITEGGKVDSFNGAAIGAFDAAGDDPDGTEDNLGSGYVRVDGQGSVWRVLLDSQGSQDNENDSGLAVGQYRSGNDLDADDDLDDLFAMGALELNEPTQSSAILSIRSGGLVLVTDDTVDTGMDEDVDMRIGRPGEVHLAGGRLIVGDRLDNDGLIRTGTNDPITGNDYGDGRIEVGSFLNSPFGEIRVRASEQLTIRSTGDNEAQKTISGGATADVTYFYANIGKIEIIGDQAVGKAEVDFERDFDRSENGTPMDDRFKNLFFAAVPDPDAPGGFRNVRGQIKSQDANIFFGSNMLNQGLFDFIGGDNLVVGEVENDVTGDIFIVNESHVTFQDDFVNNGSILLKDDSDVTFLDDFTGAGPMAFAIGGGAAGNDVTKMSIAGDGTFAASSTFSVGLDALTNLMAGASYDIIDVAGLVSDGGLSPSFLPDLSGQGLFVDYSVFGSPFFGAAGSGSADSVTLVLRAIVATVGADFNGDGIVDLADLAIWQANFGLQMGAVGQLGDADGDGDVDARDLLIIQMQLGGPGMGSASGGGSFIASVPEPTSGMLLLAGLLAAAGLRRRC